MDWLAGSVLPGSQCKVLWAQRQPTVEGRLEKELESDYGLNEIMVHQARTRTVLRGEKGELNNKMDAIKLRIHHHSPIRTLVLGLI